MNQLIKALQIVIPWLEDHDISYMVFGGVANSFYGRPRQTFDIDIKISLNLDEELSRFLHDIKKIGTIIPENPFQFIKETMVCPVEVHDTKIDFVIAGLPFEKEAVQRSIRQEIFGISMKVCQVEDLIIQKAISTRDKDWEDIEGIISTQETLDWSYINRHAKELSGFLNNSDILNRLTRLKDE